MKLLYAIVKKKLSMRINENNTYIQTPSILKQVFHGQI